MVAIALTNYLIERHSRAPDMPLDSFWTTGSSLAATTWFSPYLELGIGCSCWLFLHGGDLFVQYHLRQVLKFQVTSVMLSTLVLGLIYGIGLALQGANYGYVAALLFLGLIILISFPALITRILTILIVGFEACRGKHSHYPFYWP
ncbi:MAG TPA: hypothetical protein V6D07_00990 [Trichocoleus sp.]